MKTRFYSLAAAALMGFAAMNVSAQTGYYSASGINVQNVVEGTDYVLDNASSSGDYLCGASKSNLMTEDCLLQFISTGETVDGLPVYNIQQTSTGAYLIDPAQSSNTVSFTSTSSRAGKFTVATALEFTDIYAEIDYSDGNGRRSASAVTGSGDDAVVITAVEMSDTSYVFLCSGDDGDTPYFGSDYDSNAWLVWEVKEATGTDLLRLILDTYFPSGVDNYTAGTNPGDVDEAVLASVQSLYAEVTMVIESGEVTDEEITNYVEQLEQAYVDLAAAIVTFGEGYYYIINARSYSSSTGTGFAIYNKSGQLTFESFTPAENPTYEESKYIWQATHVDGEDDNTYYIQSYATGAYISYPSAVYTATPTSTEPMAIAVEQNANVSGFEFGWYNIYPPNNETWESTAESWGWSNYSMHSQESTATVVYWSGNTQGSLWKFVTVDESVINTLNDSVEVYQLYENMQDLLATASASYSSAIYYECDLDIENGEFPALDGSDLDGLVTSPDQLYCNLPETSEGAIENLLDGDFSTFFHTQWSVTNSDGTLAYLLVDLAAEYDCVAFKFGERLTSHTGSPIACNIYVTNDTTGLDYTSWDYAGAYDIEWTYPIIDADGDEWSTGCAVAYFGLGGNYQYVLMEVTANGGSGVTYGNLYWYASEFRAYEAQLAEESPMNSAKTNNPEIVAEFEEAMEQAQAEIAAGVMSLTQDTYDRLQAAYEAWLTVYADPAIAKDAYEEAMTWYAAAEEGTALGYYNAGSKATYLAALEKASALISDGMSMDELNDCLAQIEAAEEAFAAELVLPVEGEIYYIVSSSPTSGRANKLTYAPSSDDVALQQGGYDDDAEVRDEDIDIRMNYMWYVESCADGEIVLRNLYTGRYIPHTEGASTRVTQTDSPDTLGIRSARYAGSFNIVLSDGYYMNCNGTYIVSWASANGHDNSAWAFEVASPDQTHTLTLSSTDMQAVTLPLPIYPEPSQGGFYLVQGMDGDGNFALQSVSEVYADEIPAGTPLIYVPADGSTDTEILIYPERDVEDMGWVTTPGNYNGLQGTLQSTTVVANCGIIVNGVVYATDEGESVGANSGYFDGTTPETYATGEVTLTVDSDSEITSITAVDVATKAAPAGVYSLTGQKVGTSTKNLPAGVYIVGGQKIIVK